MRRPFKTAAGLVVAAAFLWACHDDRSPTSPLRPGSRRAEVAPGSCTTLSALKASAVKVFFTGPDANSVLGKLENLQHQLDIQDFATAQARARDIIAFTLDHAQKN